jgi:hypothetical protein
MNMHELIDATNYEWREIENGYEWVEFGSPLGVQVVRHNESQWLIKNAETSNETLSGLLLSEEQLLHYGAIAIDYVQFIEYTVRLDYSFFDLADALLAMGADYGFMGSDLELGVSLPYGAWLEIESGIYRLWNSDGLTFFATTPAGCARAWQKMEAIRPQVEWATKQRGTN